MLLIDKLPFDDKKGVCIFTHTNVAVDEIKNRLGAKGEVLFKYPNYIGTIDSFVNKYLTNPFYKSYYNNDIKAIDDDEYKKILSKTLEKNQYFLGSGTWKKIYNGRPEFIGGYIKLLSRNLNINNNFIKIEIPIKNIQSKKSYHELINIMENVLEEGFLTYRDVYYLAEIYIEYKPIIKKLFKERFKFIFIDEMQDTYVYQQNLLSKIFDNKEMIVQRFGDKNQNIISKDTLDEQCGWELHNEKEVNTTKRYGNNISNVLNYIKYEGKERLEGNNDVKSLMPHIIVFDNDTVEDVVSKFKELIEYYKIHKEDNRYKCIGRIGQKPNNKDELTIRSYCNQFNKKRLNGIKNYKNELGIIIKNNNINDYFNAILDIIVRALRENGIKYEKSKLKNLFEENYNREFIMFKQNCLEVYSTVRNNIEDIKELKNQILSFIKLYNESINQIERLQISNL